MPLLRRLFDRIVQFREGEATTAWLMFAYSFLAMTAHNLIKPLTRSKFIDSLGAGNLPYVQLAAGVVIGLLMTAYSRGVMALPRRRIIPATQAVLAGVMLLFWVLFRIGNAWVSVAFYVYGLVLGILLISQFWMLANDIYDSRQARRLFGFIGGGSSLGGVLAGSITGFAAEELGENNLLWLSALALAACAFLAARIIAAQPADRSLSIVDERGVGREEAFRLLRSSRHLQVIAAVIACAAVGAVIVEQQLNMVSASRGAGPAITEFLGKVTLFVSLAGFFIQIGLASRIQRSAGLVAALMLLPASLGGTAVIILATGAVWAPAAARIFDSSLRYTIDKTTREVLFLPLPTDVKYRAKAFVDVTIDRLARAVGALVLLILIKPWGLGLSWQQLSVASLVVTGVWIGLALVARRQYLQSFRESLGRHTLDVEAIRADLIDADTAKLLQDTMAGEDEASAVYAADLLAATGRGGQVPAKLLLHPSPRVRVRAIDSVTAVARTDRADAVAVVPALTRATQDADPRVRAAALRALATIDLAAATPKLRESLADRDLPVALAAAVALAESDDPTDSALADGVIARIANDDQASGAAERLELARALDHAVHPRLHAWLVQLVSDSDTAVARQAIASARSSGAAGVLFVPALVARLGDRALKDDARAALEGMGDAIVPALAYFLRDRDEQPWVRRHVPATLARIGGQAAMDALVAAIDEPDGFLRFKVIEAAGRLHRAQPALAIDRRAIEHRIVRECTYQLTYLTLRWNLDSSAASDTARRPLIVRTLDDKLRRSLDRIYRLLALLYPWRDVDAARYAILEGDADARMRALEYLDNLLDAPLRRRLVPIVDERPMAEKVQHANRVLHSRPRTVEDTLAQLVHEPDPVVAAAAIDLIEERRVVALADDLAFILDHRDSVDPLVVEAAERARAALNAPVPSRVAARLPVVELVDRLRTLAIFDFLSIDQLFRIAARARQIVCERDVVLIDQSRASEVVFLLEGRIRVAAARHVDAPAAFGFEDLLAERTAAGALVADTDVVCLRLAPPDALAVLADHPLVIGRLLRGRLGSRQDAPAVRIQAPIGPPVTCRPPFEPAERSLVLRRHPFFHQTRAEDVLALAMLARVEALSPGRDVVTPNDRPAMIVIVSGEVRVTTAGGDASVGRAGDAIGTTGALAGWPARYRITAITEGHALRIERDDFLCALADRPALLHAVFSALSLETLTEPTGR